MNQRIEQLIEACTTVEKGPPSYDLTYNIPIVTFDKEKFAELIVKECAQICEENGSTYKYSFTPAKAQLAESASNCCSELIQKHFGINK